MEIKRKQIKYNYSVRKERIKYIVIHDTGNRASGADADAHFNYFNGGNRNSSADVFIDDKTCLIVNDYNKYYSWHCGDGNGRYGITNSNSVGIEICINSDGAFKCAFANAVEYTKKLMKELNIPVDRVVRHYDASRKNCPQSFNVNNWAYWHDFKNRISENEEELTMAQYEELKSLLQGIDNRLKKMESKMIYNYIDKNMPEYARATIQKLVNKGHLKGNAKGELNLTDEMLRTFVILDRAGIFD